MQLTKPTTYRAADVVLLQSPPPKLDSIQKRIFDDGVRIFISKLYDTFEARMDQLQKRRQLKNLNLNSPRQLDFKKSPERVDKAWKIAPLPEKLKNRHLDLGDVSASNTAHFVEALKTDVQGIQVDFDDGHCPSWKNQLCAYENVWSAVHDTPNLLKSKKDLMSCPVLLLRPRAWNIIEHNVMIKGKEVPGAIIDFGVHMYHNAKKLHELKCGPYFYLSKLESAEEAKLWNDIFVWAQNELKIPQGTIKACVLIENIFSVFELEEILFALKNHSLGLNCGIWDYAASIIAKLGHLKQFVLPDRNKYVNTTQHFLKSYLKLVVATCHARGAPATGGMAANILPPGSIGDDAESLTVLLKVQEAKFREIDLGMDGFLFYDQRLAPTLNEMWKKRTETPNEIHRKFNYKITANDLLAIPKGGVTMEGFNKNMAVTILFIYHWLSGVGHYLFAGQVEDSATAEISRWQLWQWVHFGVPFEDDPKLVSPRMVEKSAAEFALMSHKQLCRSNAERKRLSAARYIAIELVLARYPPEFITTYLNDNHKFRSINNKEIKSQL